MGFFAAVGAFAIVVLAGYLLLRHLDNKQSQAEINRQLIVKSGDSFEFEKFCKMHPELPHQQALLEFYKDKDKKNEAIKQAKENIKREHEIEDKLNREYTIKRVFAYKYERFVLSLYSPLAKQSKGSIDDEEWECSESLPSFYLLHKLKQEYGEIEGDSLFDQFIENDLISSHYGTNSSYYLGSILGIHYNVVSDADLNMTKYIEQYGQRCTYDELQSEIKNIRESLF